jgi:hypothetical protein
MSTCKFNHKGEEGKTSKKKDRKIQSALSLSPLVRLRATPPLLRMAFILAG